MQELQEEQQAGSPLKRVKVEEQVEDDPPGLIQLAGPADWRHLANGIDPSLIRLIVLAIAANPLLIGSN